MRGGGVPQGLGSSYIVSRGCHFFALFRWTRDTRHCYPPLKHLFSHHPPGAMDRILHNGRTLRVKNYFLVTHC